MTTVVNYGLIGLLFLAWVGLFSVKDIGRDAAAQVSMLEQEIAREQATIRTLRTDWAILNEPSFLQGLAQAHLGLGTIAPRQIVTMVALPPVQLHDRRAPATGTFFASARGFQQFPTRRGGTMRRSSRSPIDTYAGWAHPTLRPELDFEHNPEVGG